MPIFLMPRAKISRSILLFFDNSIDLIRFCEDFSANPSSFSKSSALSSYRSATELINLDSRSAETIAGPRPSIFMASFEAKCIIFFKS